MTDDVESFGVLFCDHFEAHAKALDALEKIDAETDEGYARIAAELQAELLWSRPDVELSEWSLDYGMQGRDLWLSQDMAIASEARIAERLFGRVSFPVSGSKGQPAFRVGKGLQMGKALGFGWDSPVGRYVRTVEENLIVEVQTWLKTFELRESLTIVSSYDQTVRSWDDLVEWAE